MKKVCTLLMICTLAWSLHAQQYLKKISVNASSTVVFGEEVPLSSNQTLHFALPDAQGGLLLASSYEDADNGNGHQFSLLLQRVSDKDEVEWTKAYPGLAVLTHEPRPNVAMQPTADGGLVGVFGAGFWFSSSYNVVRFDANGEIMWSKEIQRNQPEHGSAYLMAYGVVEMANGDIMFVGGLGYEGFLLTARLDGTTGAWISSKRIRTVVGSQINDVKATRDGGLLLVGALENNGHSNRDLLLIKTDDQDELDWVRRIDEIEDIIGIAAYEFDDTFIVFGRVSGAVAAFSINTDDASYNWARAYFLDTGFGEHDVILPISRDGDMVYLSGSSFDNFEVRPVAVLMQFNMRTGMVDWAMRHADSDGFSTATEQYARVQEDQLMTIRGRNAIFMQQFTIEENLTTNCTGTTFESLDIDLIDGAITMPGWPVTVQNDNWGTLANLSVAHESFTAVVEVLCEQEEVAEEEEEEEEEPQEEEELSPLQVATDIIIAPNPTPDGVRIALPGYQETAIILNLFDAAGRFIKKETRMVDGILDYDLSTLPSGTYFLQFRTETDVFAKRIVKIDQ
jgi:hypothetical protein